MELLEKVKSNIEKYGMLKKGFKVLIGCSGGVDSMVLLDCICRLKDEYSLDITVAHLNHMLRPEADDDEKFVIEMCKRYNIKCITRKVDVAKLKKEKGLSEEEAGRSARYSFFYEIAQELNIDRILLGHNKNDVVETFFLNLFRGSGMEGLASVPPVRDIIARPLINVSREEIEEFAKVNNIPFVVDKTNFSLKYKRNIVRNEILPLIKEKFGESVLNTIFRTVEIIREESDQIEELAQKYFQECVQKEDIYYVLNIEKTKNLPAFLRRRIIKMILEYFNSAISYDMLKEIEDLFSLPSGKKKLYKDLVVEKQNDSLVFYRKAEESSFCFEICLDKEHQIFYKNFKFNIKTTHKIENQKSIYIDIQQIAENKIFLRTRRDGDFIYLKAGKKKLKDWFIDKKIPKRWRDSILLLAKDSEVIAIFDIYSNIVTINQKYKIKPDTRTFLEIEFTKMEGDG
ncbi:tRNA(Ile)-lysidine synthetase [Caldicellulosiruptor hydrothermalis 108]|uniref:tRNA(Ile)-lysidine synthase n=1 Tax=Caldicellulosiruptor hydrothermalis (strain DSM 18901 / VKM B-2411 / 108) TaxID=632292 RepID=E4QEA7_CALH1|nr:tRNA lysidine(34) synthetase TilS [Caldicellulosiruptor hydrothermalis]ADQ07726.1 tRNA(Ile)-lysidine synthetase [Caldicellulosiruptor hydrothermalis 108]